MRRTNKSDINTDFFEYAQHNPLSTWKEFRDYNGSSLYRNTKDTVFYDQNNLCAYCETDLKMVSTHEKRIEHFKSKSGCPIPTIQNNWNIEWGNLLGVCLGGQDTRNSSIYALPQNLSCDAHKENYENRHSSTSKDWHGYVLFPLDNYISSLIFDFNKSSGELIPNKQYCDSVEFENNKHESTYELVLNTIMVFNLNCDRLNKARLQILYEYNKLITKISSNTLRIEAFLDRWYNVDTPKMFQTTRNILIRDNKRIQKIILR